MILQIARCTFLILVFLVSRSGVSQPLQKLGVGVHFEHSAFRMNGVRTVFYELKLKNNYREPVTIIDINIDSHKLKQKLFTAKGEKLSTITTGKRADSINGLSLMPADSVFVYLELPLPQVVKFTNGFKCDVRYLVGTSEERKSSSCDIIVKDDNPVVLSSPLPTGLWAAVYDPAWERGHRRMVYHVNALAHIPGRYAIDFIKLDRSGKYAHNDEDSVENWFGYGTPVLAVADGVVTTVNNSFAESKTVSSHPRYNASHATGNYVSLRIGEEAYAFYEHLQPNSIVVREGQRVVQGDTLAKLGFTGQSTGPHIHFHVANRNSPLGAEGIPFVFKQFYSVGEYINFSDFGKALWNTLREPELRVNERPSSNSVIQFAP